MGIIDQHIESVTESDENYNKSFSWKYDEYTLTRMLHMKEFWFEYIIPTVLVVIFHNMLQFECIILIGWNVVWINGGNQLACGWTSYIYKRT